MNNIPPVYQVTCPICDANPGERCMFPNGQIKKWAHDERSRNADWKENKTVTNAAYMEAQEIREQVQQYCDEHPGISESEARRRVEAGAA